MKTPDNLQVVGCCFNGFDDGMTGEWGMHTPHLLLGASLLAVPLPAALRSCAFRARPSDVSGATAASRLAFRVQPLAPGLWFLAPRLSPSGARSLAPRVRSLALWHPVFWPLRGRGLRPGPSSAPIPASAPASESRSSPCCSRNARCSPATTAAAASHAPASE